MIRYTSNKIWPTQELLELAGYFRNRLAKHNNGINSWRRNDEASVILTNSSPRKASYHLVVVLNTIEKRPPWVELV